MAAKQLGLKELPTLRADHLSEAQKKAYIIADNKLALDSEWDESILKAELKLLQDFEFDMELTGFQLEELNTLFFEPNFVPATEEEQGDLTRFEPKIVECPMCKHQFDIKNEW